MLYVIIKAEVVNTGDFIGDTSDCIAVDPLRDYGGTAPVTDFQLNIPAHAGYPFWIMFGTPFPSEVPAANLRFKNTAVDSQDKNWTDAYNLKMVESKALGFDASSARFFTLGLSDSYPDREILQPWYGYWLLVDRPEQLTITFIKP